MHARVGGAALTLGLAVGYLIAMLVIVRPLLRRLIALLDAGDKLSRGGLTAVFLALLLSAYATELIGIHAIFGALLLGALIPHDSRVAQQIREKLEDVVVVLLLPAFFAFTGMRTRLGLLDSAEAWLTCAAVIAVASVGKFGGACFAARWTGLPRMNTRGLMELIVLNVGLDLKVLTPELFAMLVVMALATTLATGPLLRAIGVGGTGPIRAG